MKLNKQTWISLLLVAIFLSSTLVVFSGKHTSKQEVTIMVDMGNGKVYKNTIAVGENTTALSALSSFAYSVDIKNGSIYCIADYCNTKVSEWKAYKIDGDNSTQITTPLENYILNKGDTLLFKYEAI